MKISDHIFLFTISDRFKIEGRGVVVVPGISTSGAMPVVRKGDPLILRTPLGDIIQTTLCEIEMIHYWTGAKKPDSTAILLPKEIHKFDIPIGTEVYLDSSKGDQTKGEPCSGSTNP